VSGLDRKPRQRGWVGAKTRVGATPRPNGDAGEDELYMVAQAPSLEMKGRRMKKTEGRPPYHPTRYFHRLSVILASSPFPDIQITHSGKNLIKHPASSAGVSNSQMRKRAGFLRFPPQSAAVAQDGRRDRFSTACVQPPALESKGRQAGLSRSAVAGRARFPHG